MGKIVQDDWARAAKRRPGTFIYAGDMYNPNAHKRPLDQGFTLLLVGGDEWALGAAWRQLVACVAPLRSPTRAERQAQ